MVPVSSVVPQGAAGGRECHEEYRGSGAGPSNGVQFRRTGRPASGSGNLLLNRGLFNNPDDLVLCVAVTASLSTLQGSRCRRATPILGCSAIRMSAPGPGIIPGTGHRTTCPCAFSTPRGPLAQLVRAHG